MPEAKTVDATGEGGTMGDGGSGPQSAESVTRAARANGPQEAAVGSLPLLNNAAAVKFGLKKIPDIATMRITKTNAPIAIVNEGLLFIGVMLLKFGLLKLNL